MNDCNKEVQQIRKSKKISLRKLAEMTGLSVSFLSNFENEKVNITVSSLHKIADALDVSVKDLLASKEEDASVVVRKDERFSMVQNNTKHFAPTQQDFLNRNKNHNMQVTVMYLPPHSNSGSPFIHDSQEFVYILSGELELTIDEKPCLLKQGDFAYYYATKKHAFCNNGEEMAEFLLVASNKGF